MTHTLYLTSVLTRGLPLLPNTSASSTLNTRRHRCWVNSQMDLKEVGKVIFCSRLFGPQGQPRKDLTRGRQKGTPCPLVSSFFSHKNIAPCCVLANSGTSPTFGGAFPQTVMESCISIRGPWEGTMCFFYLRAAIPTFPWRPGVKAKLNLLALTLRAQRAWSPKRSWAAVSSP